MCVVSVLCLLLHQVFSRLHTCVCVFGVRLLCSFYIELPFCFVIIMRVQFVLQLVYPLGSRVWVLVYVYIFNWREQTRRDWLVWWGVVAKSAHLMTKDPPGVHKRVRTRYTHLYIHIYIYQHFIRDVERILPVASFCAAKVRSLCAVRVCRVLLYKCVCAYQLRSELSSVTANDEEGGRVSTHSISNSYTNRHSISALQKRAHFSEHP